MSVKHILVLNPGGISTKVAYYEDEQCLHSENIQHEPRDLEMFKRSVDQVKYRLYGIGELIHKWGIDVDILDAVAARGGPLQPLPAGTYAVDGRMVSDIMEGRILTDHPSLLGALMARKLMAARDKPAFVVDPVSVDEFTDVARIGGLKDTPRRSLWHALNSRYTARLACERRGLTYEKSNLVVAHLGTGISVSAHRQGCCVDVNNANDMGPFSPQRAGSVPATSLVSLCFSEGASKDSITRRLLKTGGVCDHLGTMDMLEVERRVLDGEEQAGLIWRAMAYQVAKEIGAMSVACGGAELIVLTGGLAKSAVFLKELSQWIEKLAPLETVPGELEMEALANGALRVLRGEAEARDYAKLRQSENA